MVLALDNDEIARDLAAIALAAAQPVLHHYALASPARLKSDASPVTAADEESEAVILEQLAQRFPGVPVIAEELSSRNGLPGAMPREAFFVDPLDGTREFLARNGEFTINIALVRDGVPVAGVVHAPALGRIFWGGTRAFMRHVPPGMKELGTGTPIQTRKAFAPLGLLESRSHFSEADKCAMAQLGPIAPRAVGSSLKFALIAAGEADVCLRIGPTMEWDTAAGDALLRAAGGLTFTAAGAPLTYGKLEDGLRNQSYVAWGEPARAAAIRLS
jgi:3'(2'),5'-bisphosphate nucleotidase